MEKKVQFQRNLLYLSHLRIRKKGEVLNQVLVHIVLVGLIFAIFVFATAGRINGRDVKQQVLEKELALLIDSAEGGMEFGIQKAMINGKINNVEIKEGRVYVTVEGLAATKGYPYFSKYSVSVREEGNKFVVSVR
ncbi:MAG: hypothetical protein KKF50_04600 [Nanoarchaeota archaeon]|nr:hypothetical protein [Nanoarchaeota archaeon]